MRMSTGEITVTEHLAWSSSRAVIIIHRDVGRAAYGVDLTACGREIGGDWRRWRIPKWRATVDEDGQYCFAVAL